MQNIRNFLINLVLLVAAVISLSACSGGGGSSTQSTSSTWYAADGPNQSAGQIEALFDSNQLYFNVTSATNSNGEIRGQIVPAAAVFQPDNGDPFAANPLNNPVTFSTILSGDQVRPRNVISSASGYGSLTLDPVSKQISGYLVVSGISGKSARINDGVSGAAGTPLIALEGGPLVWSVPAGIILSDTQIARLSAGAYFFDVQTDAFPDGEIRGQLNQQVRFASLTGSSEVTPVTTSASGYGVLSVNPATFQFSGFVKVGGLGSTVTSAGLYIGAAGANGTLIIPLANSGNGIFSVPVNTVLSSSQVTSFNNDGLYYNIRTVNNPAGELRGQLLKSTIRIGTSALSGDKEVPPVVSPATGIGTIALNSITGQVNGSIATPGLNGTSARLHSGSATVNGPALISLASSSPVTTAPVAGVSFALDVQPVFTANCLFSCHVTGGIAPLSLQPGLAYANIISRVTPGSSSNSYLIGRLTGSIPPRMPLISPPLDTATIDLIRSWIDKGALDN